MENKPIIHEKIDEKWSNWHKSIMVGGKVNLTLQPTNQYEDGPPPPNMEFLAGLAGLQVIVQKAKINNKKIRAHGSGWSLNDIAFSNEYLVDSNMLDYIKVGIDENYLTEQYTDKSNLMVFAQCGVMVKHLNTAIEKNKLALPTSGASDGQRIVGAIATGTHGSAHAVGAMTEFVRGIHLVVLDKHVYLQRASDQVVTQGFGQWLNGAEIVNDDALFNAALVGFGGFGLIHALMIETEPQYFLERVIRNYNISDVREAITKWDLSGLGLPHGNEMPFHFECVLNPYPIGGNEKGAFVRVYYRLETSEDLHAEAASHSDTPDLHTGMALNFDDLKGEEFEKINKAKDLQTTDRTQRKAELIGFMLQIALKLTFPTRTPEEPIRVPGKWFTGKNSSDLQTRSPIPATSLELGVPFDRVGDAMDLVIEVANKYPFAAPLAFRYVKRSSATLGFTGLADITVTIEMPGPYGWILFNETGNAHQEIFKALAESDIPHSFHWGQQFPKNDLWVRKTYGDQAVDEWINQRKKLLGDTGINMFSNNLIGEIGLAAKSEVGFLTLLWQNLLSLLLFWRNKPVQ